MNITDVRENTRFILGDVQENNATFSDEELDSHIQHALEIFSRYLPQEKAMEVETTPGSYEIGLPEGEDYISIRAVEYPLGYFPRCWCSFTTWAGEITLLTQNVPEGEPARINYTSNHVLDEAGSTISPAYSGLLAVGAAALATFSEACETANRVNSGGKDVSQRYLDWAKEKLNEYCEVLKRLARADKVRTNQLYIL
ncbi:MAG: hypothetical protein RBS96_07630 [Dehalococcoidales bacterium]|jgi:hypothetical protein|nr:hypothetical protein [Limnochordia bacterium]MDD4323155.1 hypothetical protein [Dehalococcoidales bacterium]MDX9803863.1 hypothetical protein [Dehalococcoidales bacterium]